MNETEVHDGVLRGVRTALDRAARWSNGWLWPGDTGAENLIQISVAEKLYRSAQHKPVLYLEPTIARLTGRSGDLRRVDIALLRKGRAATDDACFTAIEVKKYPGSFSADLSKLSALFEALPEMRYAFLVTYFQHCEGENGRARSVSQVIDAIGAAVSNAVARDHALGCRREIGEPIGKQVWDAGRRGWWTPGVVVHRLGPS